MKIEVLSPLVGSVTMIFAEDGAPIEEGQKIMGIECMKMQYDIDAPCSGTVSLRVELGDVVGQETILAVIEEAA